jgi:chromosomal replication initiation ATPase DnaA
MGLTITEQGARLIPLVAEEFGVSVDELMSKRRLTRFDTARRAAYYGLWLLDMSLVEIGEIMGRHHTSVMSGLRAIDQPTKDRVERLLDEPL